MARLRSRMSVLVSKLRTRTKSVEVLRRGFVIVATSDGGGFGYLLLHAAQTWRTEATDALRPHGLTVPQFLVLMELYRRARHDAAPLSQVDVATRLGMDANTASQVVRGLEARGLLERRAHPNDARARSLTLTDLGLSTSAAASADARAHNDRFFGVLSAEQLASLGTILTTLSTKSEGRS